MASQLQENKILTNYTPITTTITTTTLSLVTPITLASYKKCCREVATSLLTNNNYTLMYDSLSRCTPFVDQVKRDFDHCNIVKLEDTVYTQPGNSFKKEVGFTLTLV
jgi:hypothetical protein